MIGDTHYQKQAEAFEEKMINDPWRLSRTAQVLWHRLNSMTKKSGKNGTIQVSGSELTRAMGSTEKTFLAARDELEEKNFIVCHRGVKAAPSKYVMTQLYEVAVNG